MRPSTILRAHNGGPAREVAFSDDRFAALLAANSELFADEEALLRYLRSGQPLFIALFEYRLQPEDTLVLAA